MATIDKDFKVKNGLVVALGGSFGGAVTVGAPTVDGHAATKKYVDDLTGNVANVVFDSVAPIAPASGTFWFDTFLSRLSIYTGSVWVTLATLADAQFLQDHIHDTAIDGSGLIVSIFQDAGYYNQAGPLLSGGFYDTSVWENTWDGGVAIDNFN